MTPTNFQILTPSQINVLSSHDLINKQIDKVFNRIFNASSKKLASILLTGDYIDINILSFKPNYEAFIKRNSGLFNSMESNGTTVYLLNNDVAKNLHTELLKTLQKIGTAIVDADEDDSEKWTKKQINGQEFYEVNEATTFQDIRQILGKEGKNINFRYPFRKADMKAAVFENKNTLQMVNVHINNDGEYFGYPVTYTYICPECREIFTCPEYETSSKQANKMACTGEVTTIDSHNVEKLKRCNNSLIPDNNRTETKDSFIYDVSFINEDGNNQKAEAISFIQLPKGNIRVVLQKIPRAFGIQLVHIVDYEEIEKKSLELPPRKSKHYMFDLIKAIDDYILKITNYKHYGFLPMKMSMLLQFFARYNRDIKNNYNMALSGTMSSGKSQFSRYWGLTLYSQSCWSSNATSISIPKLRGTMESFHLFGKDYRYQYKGLFGEKDLIIIDEVKEAPDVKNNLKQYALEPTYEYSKQGSNNQTYERTAQLIITQNIDTKHLDRYAKAVQKIYMSDSLVVDDESVGPKPAWGFSEDLTLPLYAYANPYLQYAVQKARDEYERSQINWIDGSELALKQRFFFYYYLSSEESNQELKTVIQENSVNKIISNNTNIVKLMNCDKLVKYVKDQEHLFENYNDIKYFNKVDDILKIYKKRNDARTKEMSYMIIKMLRMIDGRKECNDTDLEIFTYIIENIDNKIEIINTNNFAIKGAHSVVLKVDERNTEDDEWENNNDKGNFF